MGRRKLHPYPSKQQQPPKRTRIVVFSVIIAVLILTLTALIIWTKN